MDYNDLINKIFLNGKEKLDDMEAYIQISKAIDIEVFQGEIDKYSISESGGLSLRGVSSNKMGYSYTEKLDESSIEMLINDAYENGKYIESEELEEIFSGSDNYQVLNNFNEDLSKTPIETKIELIKNLEKEALSLDKRVVSVQDCLYNEFEQSRYIVNTKGIDLHDRQNGGILYISVVVKDGEDTKTGKSYKSFFSLGEVDYKQIAKEAVDEALSMLGASPIETNDYPVVIKNIVFADILSAFSSVFSADYVNKGLSLLIDKVGKEVANPLLTIVDDPFYEEGFATRAFDDEGMKTTYKKVIDKGILTTYLHSLKTAKKVGIVSTGNSKRGSYKSSLNISPSNFYIEKGKSTFNELIESVNNGIYITDVAGLHSGLDPISGDFSLSASGYEILDGKIHRPVNQITIASNLYELLKNIEAIGDDLSFSLPSSVYFGSPSIKIKSISVAGA